MITFDWEAIADGPSILDATLRYLQILPLPIQIGMIIVCAVILIGFILIVLMWIRAFVDRVRGY